MRVTFCALIATVVLLGGSTSWAHHSLAADYLVDQRITVEGKITQVTLRNPHSLVLLDVTDAAGKTTQWSAEWGSVIELRGMGVVQATLSAGDKVSVTGAAPKDPAARQLYIFRVVRPADGWTWDRQTQITASTSAPQPDPGPAADMVRAAMDAFNKRDLAYFQRTLSNDVVWLDEDGHAVTPKTSVVGSFLRLQLSGPSVRTITPTNIRSGMTTDAAWASFSYTLDTDGAKKLGLATMVFKKVGTDWQIVLVHAASNHPATHTPIP
ncbi:MAG TPA: DUF6152 family protein [Terriglobia bacterium]|nr:DUF6152 family protein [Terriglobia bacterium]